MHKVGHARLMFVAPVHFGGDNMAQFKRTQPESLEATGGGLGRPGTSVPGLAAVLALFLFGCAGSESKKAEEATPEDYCRSRGFDVGSAEYGECVEHQRQLGVVRFFSRDQMVRPR